MRNNSQLRNELFDEAIRLYYCEGLSEDRVAFKIDIGHTTVHRWVKEYAVQRDSDKHKLRTEMGAYDSQKKELQKSEKDKLVRQLTRKLNRARKQVEMLEQLIQTLDSGNALDEGMAKAVGL